MQTRVLFFVVLLLRHAGAADEKNSPLQWGGTPGPARGPSGSLEATPVRLQSRGTIEGRRRISRSPLRPHNGAPEFELEVAAEVSSQQQLWSLLASESELLQRYTAWLHAMGTLYIDVMANKLNSDFCLWYHCRQLSHGMRAFLRCRNLLGRSCSADLVRKRAESAHG